MPPLSSSNPASRYDRGREGSLWIAPPPCGSGRDRATGASTGSEEGAWPGRAALLV
jgi:hypothetical protein